MRVDHLFAGGVRFLEPEGQRTGLFKEPQARVLATREGIVGDFQADRRNHGGAEKAICQYAVANYRRIAARFAMAAVPEAGSFGENVGASAMDERSVCIGDCYQVGGAQIEVSQPRTPCWKLNHRFAERELSRFVLAERITGWYYRVIGEGAITVGDAFSLIARPNPRWTIDRVWCAVNEHRPDPAELRELAGIAGLAPDWARRLHERADFLERKAPGARGS